MTERLLSPELEPHAQKPYAEVLPPKKLLEDIVKRIPQAERRLFIKSMTWDADHVGGSIAHAVQQARDNNPNLNIQIEVDDFVNMVTQAVPHSFMKSWDHSEGWRDHLRGENQREIARLQEIASSYRITNKSHIPVVGALFGRDHRKTFVIDDTVYIGGLNISQEVFEADDFMVRIEDKDLADAVVDTFFNSSYERAHIRQINPQTKLIVEPGHWKSRILDYTSQRVASLESGHIYAMSQRVVAGKFANELAKAAQRGIDVSFVTSPPDKATPGEPITPIPASDVKLYTTQGHRCHGKLVIIDDGQRVEAIFGSHNFDIVFVLAKTDEDAIATTDPRIVAPIQAHYTKILSESERVTKSKRFLVPAIH